MNNVEKFFDLYHSDPALRERIETAQACYPGSLEIRESVVQDVLLPIAAELGLPFSVGDLRVYETRVKLMHDAKKKADEDEEDDECDYWLLERGWTNDDSAFRPDGKEAGK